jgi:hypothetical protein
MAPASSRSERANVKQPLERGSTAVLSLHTLRALRIECAQPEFSLQLKAHQAQPRLKGFHA